MVFMSLMYFVFREHLPLLLSLRPAGPSSVIPEAPSPSPQWQTNQASFFPLSGQPPLQSEVKLQRSLRCHGHLTKISPEKKPSGHWANSSQRRAATFLTATWWSQTSTMRTSSTPAPQKPHQIWTTFSLHRQMLRTKRPQSGQPNLHQLLHLDDWCQNSQWRRPPSPLQWMQLQQLMQALRLLDHLWRSFLRPLNPCLTVRQSWSGSLSRQNLSLNANLLAGKWWKCWLCKIKQ